MGQSLGSTGIGNPIGRGVVPPSHIQSGLTQSLSPIDSGGNLGNMMITGNVEGGKHFRGSVPYQSTTDFRAGLGSSSLDSFLRYSAGSEDLGGDGWAYRPFYSPTGTVATTSAGRSAVFTPASTPLADRAELSWTGLSTDQLPAQYLSQAQGLGPGGLAARSLPMARTTQELERSILADLRRAGAAQEPSALGPREAGTLLDSAADSHLGAEEMTSERYRDQMQQLERQLKSMGDKVAELRQSLLTERTEEPRLAGTQPADQGTGPQPLGVDTQTDASRQVTQGRSGLGLPGSEPLSPPATQDLLEQLKQPPSPSEARAQLDRLLRSISQKDTNQPPAGPPQSTPPEKESAGAGKDALPTAVQALGSTGQAVSRGPEDVSRLRREISPASAGLTSLLRKQELSAQQQGLSGYAAPVFERQSSSTRQAPTASANLTVEPDLSALEQVNKLSADELSAQAKRILGDHQDYASYSASKFSQYFKAGQEYLKQGKYYRAVDAYTLASIYKPGDPVVFAGKSLALFAAGEYMSSALFLSRALQVLPEYARLEIDLAEALGSKDQLERRLSDAEECLQICRDASYKVGGVGQLQFLLAYIYLRTGRLSEAKKAIDEAYQQVPDVPGVKVLKEAIDRASPVSQSAIK
jgi:tetratricopeptide (TPR) repeat protein